MKRIIIPILTFAMLLSFAACTAPATQTVPSEQAVPTVSEAAAPSPIEKPTEEPTPTPEPVPESVQRFSADPRQFILDAVCSQQTEMEILLSAKNTSSAFATASPDLIHYFSYKNYNENYDEASGETAISNETAQYEISLQFADSEVDYSDSFNYKWLAMDIGLLLNLEYDNETITTYSSDGSEDKIVQKWAQGSEDSYSASWLYVDSSYTDEGTALLTYSYPGQNDAFNTLVADSFKMTALPFVSVLAPYEQTSSSDYSPNHVLDYNGPAQGNVGISWWNVTEDGIGKLAESLSSNPNASVVATNDFFHSYSIAIESDYFDSITVEYYNYSGDETEPGYRVNCYIYFK